MKSKKLVSVLMMLTLILSQVFMSDVTCAAKIKLTKKQMTLQKGKTAVLKVKTQKPKAKWSIKSGKKCIRLSSRKKSSVKVKGIKKGTAKIQCKIGKKKLFCKVRVTDAKRPEKPSLPPANTPTPDPALAPCPTHIPTEDRLMAEPCKSYEAPTKDENGFPIWRPWGNEFYYFFGSELTRGEVGEIIFTDTNTVPAAAEWSMDVSERQNKSVMAWYMDADGDGEKEMTIGQQGGVVANPNSSYLFCDLYSVKGLNHFYTSDVTDMSGMFLRFALLNSREECQKLDLGCQFDTSNVTNMSQMFYFCGYISIKEINFGKYFDVSRVTQAFLMFEFTSGYSDMKYYVPSEEVKAWMIDEKNHTSLKESDAYKIVVMA